MVMSSVSSVSETLAVLAAVVVRSGRLASVRVLLVSEKALLILVMVDKQGLLTLVAGKGDCFVSQWGLLIDEQGLLVSVLLVTTTGPMAMAMSSVGSSVGGVPEVLVV